MRKKNKRRDPDIIERYKDKKGTLIYIYWMSCGVKSIDVNVQFRKKGESRHTWGDEFMETLDYIEPGLYDYLNILDLLRNDKPARRWFRKRALEIRLYKYTLADFIGPNDEIDWEKVRRLEAKEGGN